MKLFDKKKMAENNRDLENHKGPLSDEEVTEARKRTLSGYDKRIVNAIGIFMVFTEVYILIFAMITPFIHTSIFMAFIIVLCFLVFKPSCKMKKNRIPWYDWIIAAVSSSPFIYVAVNYNEIIERTSRPNQIDKIMTVIALLAAIECGRRLVGWALPIIASLFIAYAMFGGGLPGIFAHNGYDITRLSTTMLLSSSGLFSSPVRTAATMVFMFVLFGSFLNATGAGQVLTNLAMGFVGKYTGGPAKVSVIASALMGTVSGSSTANVVTTGQITIPLMISTGYKRYFAAAVEAAASTGGTLTPPIMGAAAFVMAETIGTGYAQIVYAAIVPALLYYVAIMFSVHFEAKKRGLAGLPKQSLPIVKEVVKEGFHVLIPLVFLIALIVSGYPVIYAAFYGTIAFIVMSMLKKKTRLRLNNFADALIEVATSILQPAAACACAGIVTGILGLTGLGVRFSSLAMNIAEHNIFLALLVTMVICIILGMGLPVVAAYIIGAAIAAPALIGLSFPVLASHLFVFYFACISPITPPVAVTAYIGAGIAQAKPIKSAFTACMLAISAFIVPYLFIFEQTLLLEGTVGSIVWRVALCGMALLAFSTAFVGFMNTGLAYYERVLFFAAFALLIWLNTQANIAGIILFAAVIILQYVKGRKNQNDKNIE